MDMKNNKSRLLFLLVLSLRCYAPLGGDTISANSSISGDRTIVSTGGNFELGFFKPGKLSNFYIGIWYYKISIRTIVWVANRDRPVSDRFSAHLLIRNGSLVLLNRSRIPVWTSSDSKTFFAPSRSDELEAVLLDSGNFVLRHSRENQVWQSFDYPTDTWLPGSKIALNKVTGQSQRLTSWKNPENPAPGRFTLELDPNGSSQYLILWNMSKQFWTSGTWNGQIFSLVPEMRLNYIYNFSYQSNENESYFIYSVYDSSILSRFIMDYSGQVKQETWLDSAKEWNLFWSQPRTQCGVYDFCGAFGTCNEYQQPFCQCLDGFHPSSQTDWNLSDFTDGCLRKTPLNCNNNTTTSNGPDDRFVLMPSMKLPENPQIIQSSRSTSDCESACLSNCSCTAYTYDTTTGCSTWAGNLLNLQKLLTADTSGKSLYLRLTASEFPKKSKGRLINGMAAGSASGVLLILFVFIILARWRRNKASAKSFEGSSLVAFTYRELQAATKNFSDKLGGGGFGSVFKGTVVDDSTAIAVKRLESFSQGEKQFRTEVSTIGTIQHVNLTRLRGFCSEGDKKLLVYDYMPNRSLDGHLFLKKEKDGCSSNVLDWETRYRIAVGIARGLLYLHEKCRDCIIHCDIKPENILLDSDFCPKVADFGLAKLVGRDFSRVLTTMRGTRGYLAPEWISGVPVTAKADVYSYGMMLFEFVSGARNTDGMDGSTPRFFPNWAASVVADAERGGDVMRLVDARLDGVADVGEVGRLCKVACWCIQDDEGQRPSMGQVVQILEGLIDVNVPPVPRCLQLFGDVAREEDVFFFNDSSSNQTSKTPNSDSSASSSSQTQTFATRFKNLNL